MQYSTNLHDNKLFQYSDYQLLDEHDPLTPYREKFLLPPDKIYFCGHSLGALPKNAIDYANKIMLQQHKLMGAHAWNEADWINLPEKLGNQIAKLLGAQSGEVIIADSTSVNLFKILMAGLKLRPKRKIILTEIDNFPTDSYIADAIAKICGDVRVIKTHRSDIYNHIDDNTAIVMLSHINYKSGEAHDLPAITSYTHQQGALMLCDLSHSAGVFPINLTACNIDFAVGSTYKYLSGGPGAPAFLYVAKRHQNNLESPLTGWMGHQAPFNFSNNYIPASGIRRFLCGTPPILSMGVLKAGIDLISTASIDEIRKKSQLLGDLFIKLIKEKCPSIEIASPTLSKERGGHITLIYPNADKLTQALSDAGIICDFRPPHLIRFGLSPLYIRYIDIFHTVNTLSTTIRRIS